MRGFLRFSLIAILALAGSSGARAIDIDWSASVGLSSGDGNYLNLSLSHFDSDPDQTVVIARRLAHPEADLPVLLFLARESGKSLSFVLELRLKGMSWWEIRAHLGVSPDRVIVELPRDPGPPYGKAWGHYKNKKKAGGQQAALVLSDEEFSDWVGIRVLSQTTGVDVMTIIEARRSGTSMGQVADKHHPRGKGTTKGSSASSSSGKSKGKGKGAGK